MQNRNVPTQQITTLVSREVLLFCDYYTNERIEVFNRGLSTTNPNLLYGRETELRMGQLAARVVYCWSYQLDKNKNVFAKWITQERDTVALV